MAGEPAPAPSREYFDSADGGCRGVILRQPGGHSVEILNGARVMSWKTSGRENLFQVHPANALGGIRIYFPKMFHYGNLVLVGFARRGRWGCVFPANEEPDMVADFFLDHTNTYRIDYENWPNKFEFWLRFILRPTGQLSMISRIKNVNTDGRSFAFSFSYQNFFSVSDIRDVRIEGLEGKDYLDATRNEQRVNQRDEFVTFSSAVDRLYLDAPNRIATMDDRSGRIFTTDKSLSLPDIAVWHPWDEYMRNMVCVDAAAQENEITLVPDQEWMAEQHLSVTVFHNFL